MIVDSIPLLVNTEYTNRFLSYCTKHKFHVVMWSRFKQTQDTDNLKIKNRLYGHVGGYKTITAFRRELSGKLDFNLPIILVDNDDNSLARGGFDCPIDIRKHSDLRFNSSVIGLDLIFADITNFLSTWSRSSSGKTKRNNVVDDKPSPKKIKWNC